MIKKKISKSERIEKALAFLRQQTTGHLTDTNQKRLLRLKYEGGKDFSPVHWGLLIRMVLVERKVIKKPNKAGKRRKRRLKGRGAAAAPVTQDQQVVPVVTRQTSGGIFVRFAEATALLERAAEQAVSILSGKSE